MHWARIRHSVIQVGSARRMQDRLINVISEASQSSTLSIAKAKAKAMLYLAVSQKLLSIYLVVGKN